MAHQVVLEILSFTFLWGYSYLQHLKARLLYLYQFFELHWCFTHFAFDLVLDDFIGPSWEQKLIIFDGWLVGSFPKLEIDLLISETYFPKNITFALNFFLWHLAEWNCKVHNPINFVWEFDCIAHHKFVEDFSFGCLFWLDLIEKSIVVVKEGKHI